MSDRRAHMDAGSPPAPESPARSRMRFWIKLLSVMGLSVLLIFVVYRVVAHRALNHRIQAVRDAGYPIEPAELNDWYPTPEVNAADIYQRAFAAFPMDHEIEGYENIPIVTTMEETFVLGEPLDSEMAKRIEDYLAHYDETISLLEEAALIESCRFPGDYREGINLLLPHLGQLRRSARVLQLHSILDHDRGEHDLAIQRCLTIIAIGRSVEREPIIISGLVSISIQSLAYEQIEMLVASGQISAPQLHALTKAIAPTDFYEVMLRGMVGERCNVHGIFGDSEMLASAFHNNGALGQLTIVAYRSAGLLDIDHSSALDIMRDAVEYAENPTWPMPPELEDLDQRIPRICVVTRMMVPALSACHKAARRVEAKRQAVLTGIAVERYRQTHGRFPAQLTDLAPQFIDAVPQDPFDGQPLRYRTEDAGVIIYSLGIDGIDHQGRRYNDEGVDYQEDTDITFTFGGLQEMLWPLPEKEEDSYGGYGDPYGGGYRGPYGDGEPIEDEEESEEESEAEEQAESETESEAMAEPGDTTDKELPATTTE